ncbi:MAG TPA: single-stranded DNA-binding protein, partial [Thermoanaerobaculia bacterium]|nr:single-stranded DNA-binding protein [Thermoanaerobaculia bacterium]
IAGQYLTKGKQIYLEGRLQTRSWDDRQTGEKRYRTEVICENFQMLGSRTGGGGGDFEQGGAAPGGGGGGSYDEGGYGGGGGDLDDDDIPF